MNLNEKLIDIQCNLKAPKDKRNDFGKFNYRSYEGICEAVKPYLAKHGLLMTATDELVMLGDRYYVKASVTLTDGTDSISTTAYAREDEDKKGMDGSQITGSASSYARKYAANGMFLIDDNKDADTNEYRQMQETKTEYATAVQVDRIRKGIKEIDKCLAYYKVSKLEDLTVQQASEVINSMLKKGVQI